MKTIDKLKREKGYTYLHMSEMLKCSKSYIWQLFNGKRNLSYKQAILIASIFNMKPDEIFYSNFIDDKLRKKINDVKKVQKEIDSKKV